MTEGQEFENLFKQLSAGHRGVNIKTNNSKEWIQIGILGMLKISNQVF